MREKTLSEFIIEEQRRVPGATVEFTSLLNGIRLTCKRISWLIGQGRARYTWCTLIPLAFMCINTLTAGWMNLRLNYLRAQFQAGAPDLWTAFLAAPGPARVQCVVTLAVMALMIVVVADCASRWLAHLRDARNPGATAGATS